MALVHTSWDGYNEKDKQALVKMEDDTREILLASSYVLGLILSVLEIFPNISLWNSQSTSSFSDLPLLVALVTYLYWSQCVACSIVPQARKQPLHGLATLSLAIHPENQYVHTKLLNFHISSICYTQKVESNPNI